MGKKLWPNHVRTKEEGLDWTLWVRRKGTDNRLHLPNPRKFRAICSTELPLPHEQETVINPPLWERCISCQREFERRTKPIDFAPRPWLDSPLQGKERGNN